MATKQQVIDAKYDIVRAEQEQKLKEIFCPAILAFAKENSFTTFEEIVAYTGEIDFSNYGIDSLKGIELIVGVTDLRLSNNPLLTKIDLTENVNLTVLIADNCSLTSVGSLSNKPDLTYINLRNNSLVNLGTLNNSPLLTTIFLENNSINFIDSVSNLVSVSECRLSGNELLTTQVDVLLSDFDTIKQNGGSISNLYLSGNSIPTDGALNTNFINLTNDGVVVTIDV